MNKMSLLELAKKVSIPCRNCMNTREELEESKVDGRFDKETCMEGLQRNILMDGDMATDKRTGEVLDPDVDSTYWKDKS